MQIFCEDKSSDESSDEVADEVTGELLGQFSNEFSIVKENYLISELAFSHYSDRYDLIERLFEVSNLSDSISQGSRYASYHMSHMIMILITYEP